MKDFLKKVYTNVGNKIQCYAKIFGIVGVTAGIVLALIDLFEGFSHYYGILLAYGLGAACASIIVSWFLYAFGQITNDIRQIAARENGQTITDEEDIPDI